MKERGTLLIIDDDPRNIFALSAVLRSRGFRIFSGNSVQEGLELLLHEQGIGAVLLDMMMPGMDGYEGIGAIRKAGLETIPIVAVTAQAMTGDREKCLEAGASGYVSKPVDVDTLLSVLKNLGI